MSNKVKILLDDGSWWITTTDNMYNAGKGNPRWAFFECTDLEESGLVTQVNVDKVVRFVAI
jgi:hypothetical protein